MSILWSIVSVFLYLEIGFSVLLLVPFVSAQLWYKCLRPLWQLIMRVKRCRHYVQFFFFALLAALTVACISSFNDTRRFSSKLENLMVQNPQGEMMIRLKLLRAQRNFYITGFAILMAAIIRRLLSLISSELNGGDKSNSANAKESDNELSRKVKALQIEKERLSAENKALQEKIKGIKSKSKARD